MAAYVRHSKETVIVNSAEDTGDLYMETAYLKEFIVLAKMCNYNRAADELLFLSPHYLIILRHWKRNSVFLSLNAPENELL